MTSTWARHAVVYHIYPLGCLGAPTRNPFTEAVFNRLSGLYEWLDYLQDLGTNTLLLGPVFESTAHGLSPYRT